MILILKNKTNQPQQIMMIKGCLTVYPGCIVEVDEFNIYSEERERLVNFFEFLKTHKKRKNKRLTGGKK